jgi:hypothetical protein
LSAAARPLSGRARDLAYGYGGVLRKLLEAVEYLKDGGGADWIEAARAIGHVEDFARHYDLPSKEDVVRIQEDLMDKWRKHEPKRESERMVMEIADAVADKITPLIVADAKAVDPAAEEDQIAVLMAREIVEDVCEGARDRARCRSILHRVMLTGQGLSELSELSEEDRRVIRERLRELGAG